MRLHQAYPQYTAGDRKWSISGVKPATHLATKGEILAHFQDVVAANVEEKELQLITLFTYVHDGSHTIVQGSAQTKRVQLVARPLQQGVGVGATATDWALPPVVITADRVIQAAGFDV